MDQLHDSIKALQQFKDNHKNCQSSTSSTNLTNSGGGARCSSEDQCNSISDCACQKETENSNVEELNTIVSPQVPKVNSIPDDSFFQEIACFNFKL